MKKLTTALLTLIIISCLSLVSAQTIVPGGYVSGAWNAAGSPYLVEGEITVHADSTLNIEPGVTVNFQGHYKFIVNGFLEAQGSESDSILFTAADTVAGWHSIRFIDAPDSSHLNYCIIQYGYATGATHADSCGGGICCSGSSPTISNCDIINNEGLWSGGGIYSDANSNPIISYCTISENRSRYGGGIGIGPTGSPTISNCTITDNSISDQGYNMGGGIGIFNNYSPLILISYCTITGNSAIEGLGCGGGIEVYNSNSVAIENCTVCMNSSTNYGGGGIDLWDAYLMSVTNTIVAGNTGFGGIWFDAPLASVSYGDYFGNENGNFTGTPPVGLGVITGVNANGDPCDNYSNIFLNAQFVEPANGDFHLQANSPCIDAGDPLSPLDPDSTIADMGAFYYYQGLDITLTPLNPPITIPAQGGSFDYTMTIENIANFTYIFDVWVMVFLPDFIPYGPVLLRTGLTLPSGGTLTRTLTQSVPGHAPPGRYAYGGHIGIYPDSVITGSGFTFTKLAGDAASAHNQGWTIYGWSDEEAVSLVPKKYTLHNPNPNPFNPETNLTFSLPEAGEVSLIIYDIQGREVVRLIDGFHPAGVYEATFNGSMLSSGVYFARLQADGFSQTRKLLLIK